MLLKKAAEGIDGRKVQRLRYFGNGRILLQHGHGGAQKLGVGWKVSPSVVIKAGETFILADIRGEGVIRHIWMVDNAVVNRPLVLRLYWDGSEQPSAEVPLCDFFASAEYQKYTQLTSAVVCVNPKRALNCYWEMPFYNRAKVTLENITAGDITVYYQIDYTLETLPKDCLYFHAQFRRVNPLPYKQNYTILEGVSGKGQYVGTYLF